MSDLIANQNPDSIVTKIMTYVQQQAELVHEKTGIPAKYVLIGLAVCVASVVIGYLDTYITCLVGIVIPSICSIRAIETKDPEDDKQWLTYWVVYGIFTFIDLFSGFILKYVPFYFVLKILFLIWLFLPSFKGASIIYKTIIVKFFNKYREQIDDLENKFEDTANKYIGNVKENVPGANNFIRNPQGATAK